VGASVVVLLAANSAVGDAASGQISLRRGAQWQRDVTIRQETCRFCYRQCSIACFVGTCGMEYGYTVTRFMATKSCWTCDASSSVGINKAGDFSVCSADEAAASHTYPKMEDDPPPMGAGIPGDAKKEADNANAMAHLASKNALQASEHADKAAMAALAKLHSVAGLSKDAQNAIELAEAHRLALQIRAEEAKKTALAAEMARKLAADKFNVELAKLKKQQLISDGAEQVLVSAEKYAEQTQNAYTVAAAAAAQAAREAAMLGASAAGASAQEAAAKEMLAAMRAAQRRAMDAAKAAKSAAEKAAIAAEIGGIPPMPDPTMPPCAPSLLQGGHAGEVGKSCTPSAGGEKGAKVDAKPPLATTMQEALTSAQQILKAADTAPLSAPPSTQEMRNSGLSSGQPTLRAGRMAPSTEPLESLKVPDKAEDTTGTGAVVAEPTVLLKPPDLADTLVTKLASKLEDDPEAASNPQNFDISQMPDVQAQMQARAQEKYQEAGQLMPTLGSNDGVADDGSSLQQPTDAVSGLPMDPSQLPTVSEGLAQTGFSALAMSALQVGAEPIAAEPVSLGEGGEFFDVVSDLRGALGTRAESE